MGKLGAVFIFCVFSFSSVAAEPEKTEELEKCSVRLRELGEQIGLLQREYAAVQAAIDRLSGEKADGERQFLLAAAVGELCIGAVANRRCRQNGIETVGGLLAYTQVQLALLGFTPQAIAKMETRLAEKGFRFPLAAEMTDPPVEVLNLPTALHNKLFHAGIRTLGQLTKLTARQILGLSGFGEEAVRSISAALEARGLRLAPAW